MKRLARPYSYSCHRPMTVFPTGVCPQADAPPLDTGSATGKLLIRFPVRYSCICSWVVSKVNDTPEPESEGDMKEGSNSMPPNLEEFIPGERLPDSIDVYVNWDFLFRASEYFTRNRSNPQHECTIKFVRQYPRRTVVDKGMPNTPS
jgi:hypothetical protein